MQVRILFFGMLREIMGQESDAVALPDSATVQDLIEQYANSAPRLRELMPSVAISINQEYVPRNAALKNGDEVALLPPVSGGAPQAPLVRLTRERIVPHDIVPALKKPEDGAIVIFDGIVRNHSRGRRTLYLEYEAYESMALAQLQKLAAEASERFEVREAAIVHRLGRLEIGESSVLIAVFSAHRAAAFEACRWLIDTLKKTVPIWKKEYFEDGAVWADGEPFPAEIPKAGTIPGIPPASKLSSSQ